MQTPTPETIKNREKNFYLVRQENYNGNATPNIAWQVWEKTAERWKLDREYSTKRDATHWLYVCAGV